MAKFSSQTDSRLFQQDSTLSLDKNQIADLAYELDLEYAVERSELLSAYWKTVADLFRLKLALENLVGPQNIGSEH